MENARLLDEKLKNIIREIGGRTGEEIKALVVEDIIRDMEVIIDRHSQRQLIRLLTVLKKGLDEI
jgi:hypothetical protein